MLHPEVFTETEKYYVYKLKQYKAISKFRTNYRFWNNITLGTPDKVSVMSDGISFVSFDKIMSNVKSRACPAGMLALLSRLVK